MLYVITGPPAAGKSSWIDAHAKPTDIVIDLDRITQALTGPGAPSWNQQRIAVKVALRARYAAIEEACQHLDDTDVYLIHTMPQAKAKARYKRLGAKVVVVDPGRDVVMQRIADMRSTELEAVATRWYNHHRGGGSRPVTPQTSREW
ncbi:AAA family ATPase [Streptomyces phaeochromogenes]|uniref:AAA family ATPase n=1 Tax=Streptomyces phaeochromogenes TaxID=1923 RepID=UPI003676A4D8